jgi:hypothetical protein
MTAEPGVLYAHACFETKKGTAREKHFGFDHLLDTLLEDER